MCNCLVCRSNPVDTVFFTFSFFFFDEVTHDIYIHGVPSIIEQIDVLETISVQPFKFCFCFSISLFLSLCVIYVCFFFLLIILYFIFLLFVNGDVTLTHTTFRQCMFGCHVRYVSNVVTGLLPMMDRQLTSSVSSQRTFESIQSRRASSAQGMISRGVPVSASRAGAARAAAILLLSYCHDNTTTSTITTTTITTTKSPAVLPYTPKSLHIGTGSLLLFLVSLSLSLSLSLSFSLFLFIYILIYIALIRSVSMCVSICLSLSLKSGRYAIAV